MPWTRAYEDGRIVAEGFPVEEISDHLDAGHVVFADLTGSDPPGIAATLREELGLHDLAVEDALGRPQRTKVDRYPGHLFLSAYQTTLGRGRLQLSEIAVFVTERAVVTVRKSGDFDLDAVRRVWDDHPELAPSGPAFLLHGVLDHVVETYLDVLEALEHKSEKLETELFSGPSGETRVRRQSLHLRKNLLRLRKVALPMREVMTALTRMHDAQAGPTLDPAMAAYYQDVYDHVLRVTDWSETLRDIVATTLETETSLQGNRLNVTMKQLTAWAAVIAVPTLITGFYGQNVPFPGSGATWGFVASVVLIVGVTGAIYLNFKRRDWL